MENIQLSEGMEVLCLGCGNVANIVAIAEELPDNISFLLTDYSEGMLEKAKNNIAQKQNIFTEKNITVRYQVADANVLSVTGKYDRITANHNLYHVEKRHDLFQIVKSMLKPEGMFCATTVGDTHMRELHELVARFDSRIEVPAERITCGFRLENGEEQLAQVFEQIECVMFDSDLLVDEAEPVYHYVYSYPGKAHEFLEERKQDFLDMVNEIIQKEGAFYIHKSTGMFRCR